LNFAEAALKESALAFIRGEGECSRIIFSRLVMQAEPSQQVRARGV
jgi:hypothetical protein